MSSIHPKSSLYSSLILSDFEAREYEPKKHDIEIISISKDKNVNLNPNQEIEFSGVENNEYCAENSDKFQKTYKKNLENLNMTSKSISQNKLNKTIISMGFKKEKIQTQTQMKTVEDSSVIQPLIKPISKSEHKTLNIPTKTGELVTKKVQNSRKKQESDSNESKDKSNSEINPKEQIIYEVSESKSYEKSKCHSFLNEGKYKKHLETLKANDCGKENKNNIYLISNLIKISKDENNEIIIYVPCKLNMDLESLFYYFSNNSIYLNCEQFAKMLHCSKLYHKSKPIDILARMFPHNQEFPSYKEKKIEYNSFLKLLHRFSLFKFRSIGANEQEKLNLVISFLLNCEYVETISTKLVKSERCIQVSDPTIQRKDKNIQIKTEFKDKSSQFKVNISNIGINAICERSDVSCGCDINNEKNNLDIENMNELGDQEKEKKFTEDYSNYEIENGINKPIFFFESMEKNKTFKSKKNKKESLLKKSKESFNIESEIFLALKSINREDDKKLFRIFVYYSGPNNDRLSYRQFYNLINDSGLLGGNFEEFLTPAQVERCYSAVIIDPKGVDYWEFKEILLYCGEASSCGNNPSSAFQTIIKKYIIPLILTIYQPNNFEKCENAITNKISPEDICSRNINNLQSMINRAILPWFRLGNQPLTTESEEYSDTCSCSSLGSRTTFSETSEDCCSCSTSKSYISRYSYISNDRNEPNRYSGYESIDCKTKQNDSSANNRALQESITSEELIFMKY